MKQPLSSKQRERHFRATRMKSPDAGGPQSPTGRNATRPPRDRTKRWHYLKQYGRWLWPYRFGILAVFLLALVSAALDMVWPLVIKLIIDGIARVLPRAQQLTAAERAGVF